MSTRSTIAMLNNDGTVHAHYCHSDGYLSWNGAKLYEHYQDVNKVKQLVALGDMSFLEREVAPPAGVAHSFDNKCSGVCVFYGRDRQEDGVETQKYDSLKEYLDSGNFQEYDYIFNEKKNDWYLINQKTLKLQKLSSALLKDRDVSESLKDSIKDSREAAKLAKKLDSELDAKPKDKKPKI